MPDVLSPDPQHIALLTPCYWPEVRRGTERFANELATGLLARGRKPVLITSHPGLPSRRRNAVPVLRLPRPPQGALVRHNFEPYLTHVPLSYLALRAERPDLAHALYPADALAAARWRRRTGRPALLSYMGIPDPRWLRAARGRFRVLRSAVEGCDAVVALSHRAARAFGDSLGYQARVIPPGVDLSVFTPAPGRSDRPTIVCPAAVEEGRKNVPLLVEAFRLVRRRHPNARLVLSRPRDPAVRRAVAPVSHSPGLEWADLDHRESLARAYGEAWAGVLPSVDEAFGLVLVEALACGTPVVGYAHGAIPEIIDGSAEIGRMFAELEPEALARSLLEVFELAQDPGVADRCRRRAEEFSLERCVERYLALYRELSC